MIGEGLTYKEAAARTGVRTPTINSHLASANRKLKAPNTAQTFLTCVRAGWLTLGCDHEAEIVQLVALERLLTRLVEALEAYRRDHLTLVQRQYLDRFEEFLYAKGPGRRVAQDRLSVAFGRLTREAGIRIDHERVQHPSQAA